MDFDVTAVTVAVIAGIATVGASLVAGWFAYKAAKRVKTSNGHTSGELLEFVAEEMAWLRVNFIEHARDLEMHRIQAQEAAAKHDAEQTDHIQGDGS